MCDMQNGLPDEKLLMETHVELAALIWKLRQTANRAFEPLGFSPFQTAMLLFVARGYTSPNALADALDVHRSAASAGLRDLETQMLIERTSDESDRRRVKINLTVKGHEAVAHINESWQKTSALSLSQLTEDELTTLIRLCRKVLAANGS